MHPYVAVFLNPKTMRDAHTTSAVYCNRHGGTALSAVTRSVFIRAKPTGHITLRNKL